MEPGRTVIAGMALDRLDLAGCLDRVAAGLAAGQGGWIVTANLDHLYRFQHDPRYRELVRRATLVVPDGMPLLWLARRQGSPLPMRVCGEELVDGLAGLAHRTGRPLMLLGDRPEVAHRAARVLGDRHAGCRVLAHSPPFVPAERIATDAAVRAWLAGEEPALVAVALGSPKQELVIDALRRRYPGNWWVGVGTALAFLAGTQRRAPRWMQRSGLEWLHRLARNPRHLARRYFLHDLPFLVTLLRSRRSSGDARSA